MQKQTGSSIADCLLISTSESPDISKQNSTNVYRKNQNRELLDEKTTSGNPDVAFLVMLWRTLETTTTSRACTILQDQLNNLLNGVLKNSFASTVQK